MTRIAILSDIHFGQQAGPIEFLVPGEKKKNQDDDRVFEKRLIDLFNQMKPDYFFIAGDLTSKAEPQEFKYCEKEILKIAEASNVSPDRIICCMGNHDVDWKITRLSQFTEEEAQRFLNVEEITKTRKEMYHTVAENAVVNYLNDIQCSTQKPGKAAYTGVFESEDFVLFVLHSSLKCPPDEGTKHGRLTELQLNWLDEELESYKKDQRIKMVMLHHHPHDYQFPKITFEASKIEEAPDFLKIIERNQVNIVIHGHRHHPGYHSYLPSSQKPVVLFCAGSLSVDSQGRDQGNIPNTVHFLDVDKNKDHTVLYNYSYRSSDGWKEMKYDKQTPLDKKMLLGKVFDQDQCRREIRKYKENTDSIIKIKYEEIAEPLKYMLYNELDQMLREELGDSYDISGKFPELVIMSRKENV